MNSIPRLSVAIFTLHVSQSLSLLIVLSLRTDGGGVVGGDSGHLGVEGAGDDGLPHAVTEEDDIGLFVGDPHGLLVNPFLDEDHELLCSKVGDRVYRRLHGGEAVGAMVLADHRVRLRRVRREVAAVGSSAGGIAGAAPVPISLRLWRGPRRHVVAVALVGREHGKRVAGDVGEGEEEPHGVVDLLGVVNVFERGEAVVLVEQRSACPGAGVLGPAQRERVNGAREAAGGVAEVLDAIAGGVGEVRIAGGGAQDGLGRRLGCL